MPTANVDATKTMTTEVAITTNDINPLGPTGIAKGKKGLISAKAIPSIAKRPKP
jgi:hypothetical protein